MTWRLGAAVLAAVSFVAGCGDAETTVDARGDQVVTESTPASSNGDDRTPETVPLSPSIGVQPPIGYRELDPQTLPREGASRGVVRTSEGEVDAAVGSSWSQMLVPEGSAPEGSVAGAVSAYLEFTTHDLGEIDPTYVDSIRLLFEDRGVQPDQAGRSVFVFVQNPAFTAYYLDDQVLIHVAGRSELSAEDLDEMLRSVVQLEEQN
jgi:hypothetical protein